MTRISKKDKASLQSLVEREAAEYIKTARVNIRQRLESATLSLLGLEKNYKGQYEIDHCNGRNSVLVDAFRDIAKAEAMAIAKTYKPTKEDIAGFQAAFMREYNENMARAIREEAKKKAQEVAKAFVESVDLEIGALLN